MPRRVALGLVALAALGFAVRVAWIAAVDPEVPEVGDARAYELLAEGLADGDGYVRPFDRVLFDERRPTAEYPPVHPAVLSVASLAGVDTRTGLRVWLSLFGAASVAATGALAWTLANRAHGAVVRAPNRTESGSARAVPRRAHGSAAAFVAAGVAAAHPLWFQADATLMPETLAALLGAGVVLAALEARRRPSVARWAIAGGLCGVAALTRGEAVVLVPVVAVFARSWRSAAIVIAGAVVVIAPWTARNAARFDELVPISTNVGSVVDGANCPEAYGGDLLGYWVYGPACFEGFGQEALATGDESVVAARHREDGVDFATDHIDEWPKVAAARLGRTLGVFRPAQLADLGALEGRQQGADLAGYALVWVSVVLGALATVRLRLWLPAAVVVAVWASTALSYGNPRFLALAQPSLVALAACGATTLLARRAPA